MKNRILIFGNNDFSREYFEDGVFKINNKKIINSLYKKYNVDNLSNDNLTCKKALKLSKAFISNYHYSACIIALGKKEIADNNTECFEENLQSLVNMLLYYRVTPILLDVDVNNNIINTSIERVKKESNLKLGLYDGLIMNSKLQVC
jgi:hypothetical protein